MAMLTVQILVLTGVIFSAYGAKWEVRFPTVPISITPYKQTADLRCKVKTGTFTGFFYANGQKIETKDGKINIQKESEGNATMMTLEIVDVREQDYGLYICRDNTGSDNVTLEVSPAIEDLQPLYKLAEGFDGVVSANVYAKPRKPVSWYKMISDGSKSLLIKQNDKFVLEGDVKGYSITGRGTLVIKDVSKLDNGKYEMQVQVVGSKIKKETEILVGNRPVASSSPDTSYTITEKLNLSIPCKWDGADANGSNWVFSGNAITTGFDANGLTLTSVTQSSAGNYTCSATNDFGKTQFHTTVDVITPPVIKAGFHDVEVPVNQPLEATCSATGIPTPDVVITKEDSDKYRVLERGRGNATLKFDAIKVKNKGNYKCIASNGAKDAQDKSVNAEKIVDFDVLTQPTIVENKTTKLVTSALGLKYVISCSSFGNPPPEAVISKDGVEKIKSDGSLIEGMVVITYTIDNATKENFGVHKCVSKNSQGSAEKNITVKEVVKAKPPEGLQMAREGPGLEFIDLKWNASKGADSYLVFVNDSRQEPATTTTISIENLKRSTFYSFRVASVNIAGTGNKSKAVILKTSDITKPGPISNFEVKDITSVTATITWSPPNVKNKDLLTYKVKYCKMDKKNGTVIDKSCIDVGNEKKDTSIELKNLDKGTNYRIIVVAINQGLEGDLASVDILTKNTTPAPPSKSGKSSGLSSGAVVGVIIAVILIILIVIDLFCCFFNNCGFSHCFYNNFCASKGKKYSPADTNEEEELKPKKVDPDV